MCSFIQKNWKKRSFISWDNEMIQAVIKIKQIVKSLPCLGIQDLEASLIVEADAYDVGYGGVLKQVSPILQRSKLSYIIPVFGFQPNKSFLLLKEDILSIVLCITKFYDDLFNKKLLVRTDCNVVLSVLQKDVKNLNSKHIFARWQALLSCFEFDIVHIKGENNPLPDFHTKELLQGLNERKKHFRRINMIPH